MHNMISLPLSMVIADEASEVSLAELVAAAATLVVVVGGGAGL